MTPQFRQYIPIISVITSVVLTVLDGNIVNIALPTLTTEFQIEPNTAIWIVNAYQIAIMMFLLIFAIIGERAGYRKVFLAGIALFTTSSALCALSPNFPALVASRILQGIGAACIMSVSVALVRLIYPPKVLGRGLGLNAMAVAVSAAAGPSIAGIILSVTTWHWLFAINIPIGIFAFISGYKLLPRNKEYNKEKISLLSCIGNALTFGLMILALEGFAHNEAPVLIVAVFAALLLVGFFFIKNQVKSESPILPIDLLKIPIFSLSVTTSICSYTSQMLAIVAFPFLMEDVMHFPPVEVGILATPWPLASMVAAPIAGRLVEKIHPGILGAIGMGLFASGAILVYLLPENATHIDILWRIMLCGAGFGLFQTPNNLTIVASAPFKRSGAASGMLGMARLVGQTIGTTAVAIVFAHIHHTEGSQICFIVASIIAIVAGISSLSRLKQGFNPRQAG